MFTMRIASYNLYEGAQDTYSQLQDFITEQDIDVLCLQEVNGWGVGYPKRIDEFGESIRFPHYVYGDSNTRFKLATYSSIPMLSSRVITEGFWHSSVKTTFEIQDNTLDVWNIHLNPRGEDDRLKEVEQIVAMIDPNQPTIITGDFNSLSEADHYPDDFIDILTAQGITKFGKKRLRYDVTSRLVSAGLVDIAADLGVSTNTVPTPANKDMHHAAEMRLDYMFVSQGLVRAVKSIKVPKTPLTDSISDHYPIIMDLEIL